MHLISVCQNCYHGCANHEITSIESGGYDWGSKQTTLKCFSKNPIQKKEQSSCWFFEKETKVKTTLDYHCTDDLNTKIDYCIPVLSNDDFKPTSVIELSVVTYLKCD